jgi:molybdate transport system regulatory protein
MELLSTEEAAGYLRLKVKRIQALARAGKLPGRRVGRKWLFARRDLDALLSRSRPAPDLAAGLDLSARNQLRGTVVALTIDGVMAEVRVRIGQQELVSVITRGSAERLRLAVGDPVIEVIKSTEIMIGKEPGAT